MQMWITDKTGAKFLTREGISLRNQSILELHLEGIKFRPVAYRALGVDASTARVESDAQAVKLSKD
jgi:hypothetical protein